MYSERPLVPREDAFNFVRLACCLCVIVCHSLDLTGTPYLGVARLLDSHVAVCIFFILSGFWVMKSYISTGGGKSFYLKRIKRLLPMYLSVVIGFAIALFFVSGLPFSDYFLNPVFFKYLFWNSLSLNFMQTTLPGVFEGNPVIAAVNGSLWTIKIEIGFYLVLPLIMHVIRWFKSDRGKLGFISVLYMLSRLYDALFSSLLRSGGGRLIKSLGQQLPAFFSFFVCGMAFYLYWDWIVPKLNYFIIPSIVVLFFYKYFGTEYLLPASLTVLVMWVSLKAKFLYPVGEGDRDFSYGLYLVHFPLIQTLVAIGFFEISYTLSLFLVLGASFTLAYLMKRFFGSSCFSRG